MKANQVILLSGLLIKIYYEIDQEILRYLLRILLLAHQ